VIPRSSPRTVLPGAEEEWAEPPGKRVLAWPWVMTGVTLAALALRLYRLSAQSFWVDEVVTWHGAQLPLADLLQLRGYYAMAHSLYYAVMHGVLLVSDSEVAMRLPSAFFGALSVPLLYRVGERWLGEWTGLAAAVLLAVSPLHLHYSQEARPYAAVLFFVLFATVCLEEAVRNPARIRGQVGFVASTTAALLSHPVALAFVPVSAIYAAMARPRGALRRLRVAFAGLSIIIVGFLLVLVALPPARATNPAEAPGPFALAYIAWTFSTGFSLGPSIRELHGPDRIQVALGHAPVVALSLVLFGGLVVAGAVRVWSEHRRVAGTIAGWLLLPVLFVFFGSLATHHPLNVRYVLVALPPFLLLVGSGTRVLPSGPWRAGAWALVLGLSAASILNYHLDPRYHREDYRSAVRALKAQARRGDLVMVSAPYTAVMLDYYDPGPLNVMPFGPGSPGRRRSHPSGQPSSGWRAELDRLVAGRQRFWVLISREFHGRVGEELLPYLDDRFARERDRSWAGTQLILYSVGRDRSGSEQMDAVENAPGQS